LLDEQSLATRLVQPRVEQLIAPGTERKEPHFEPRVPHFQPLLYVLGLPQREPAAPRSDGQRLHFSTVTSFSTGHCRRLTGRRSATPSRMTSQPDSSPSPARSKPRIAARATRQLRWMRTKRSANSFSSATRASSSRCS